MATNNVGRVLVKENNKIVGIISRSDLLKAYFLKINRRATELVKQEHPLLPTPEEVKALIKNHFPEKLTSLLHTIGDIAKKTDQKVYLVGGAVRDLFLGANSLDFDFVLTKDATTFGKLLEKKIKQKVKIYPQFNTAHTTYGNYKLDFVTARREYYEKNSVLPVVENASLKEDLGRRDFTINAIAISLMPDEFGKIVDFYNGLSDLRKGIIRTFTTLSFIEDPSRLLRAIKYETKLNFKLAPETEQLFSQAIELGVLNNKRSSRITDELKELLSEEYAPKAIEKLEKRNLLYTFFGIKRLSKIKKEAIWKAESIIKQFNAERLTVYLIILMYRKKIEQIIEKLRTLNLKKKDINVIVNTTRLIRKIKVLLKRNENFELFVIARGLKKESAAGISALLSEPQRNKFAEIINKAYNTKLDVTGDDLKKLGLKEGKQYKKILDELAFLKAEGKITTKEDAIDYIIRNREKFDWNE
jgi:tRNA nucleotidyltransferase (CCA-adding enzyme)